MDTTCNDFADSFVLDIMAPGAFVTVTTIENGAVRFDKGDDYRWTMTSIVLGQPNQTLPVRITSERMAQMFALTPDLRTYAVYSTIFATA